MAEEFWSSWLVADEIKRLKMVLHLAKKIDNCNVIDYPNLRIYCIASFLKTYLEDLERILKEKVIM